MTTAPVVETQLTRVNNNSPSLDYIHQDLDNHTQPTYTCYQLVQCIIIYLPIMLSIGLIIRVRSHLVPGHWCPSTVLARHTTFFKYLR